MMLCTLYKTKTLTSGWPLSRHCKFPAFSWSTFLHVVVPLISNQWLMLTCVCNRSLVLADLLGWKHFSTTNSSNSTKIIYIKLTPTCHESGRVKLPTQLCLQPLSSHGIFQSLKNWVPSSDDDGFWQRSKHQFNVNNYGCVWWIYSRKLAHYSHGIYFSVTAPF